VKEAKKVVEEEKKLPPSKYVKQNSGVAQKNRDHLKKLEEMKYQDNSLKELERKRF